MAPPVDDDPRLEVLSRYHQAYASLLTLADDPDDWWARTVRRCAQRAKLVLFDGVEDFLAYETAETIILAVDADFEGRRQRKAALLEGVRAR